MTKVGRNDPCPCGSGKKFKKCCAHLNTVASPAPVSAEEVAYDPAMLSALMALWQQRGMSGTSGGRDSAPKLWADRYRLPEPLETGATGSPRAALEALGEPHETGVMLYRGRGAKREWEGEALWLDGPEVLFVTPSVEAADRWRERFQGELGAQHLERRQEKLEAPSTSSASSQDLLAFKRTFFAQWPDEPNEKLGGVTPRRAAADPALRTHLNDLLKELEFKERSLPRRERYDFQALRRQLDLIP